MSLSADLQEVREFVAYMRLRNLTPRTIIEYQRVVTQFLKRCPPDLQSFQDVTFEHLRAYISGLQQQGLAPKTVWDRVVILKRFFGFLVGEGCLEKDPTWWLPFPKVGFRLPKALTLEETVALLLAAPGEALSGVARRGNAAGCPGALRAWRVIGCCWR